MISNNKLLCYTSWGILKIALLTIGLINTYTLWICLRFSILISVNLVHYCKIRSRLDALCWVDFERSQIGVCAFKASAGLFIFACRVSPKRPFMCFKSANPLISASEQSVIRRTLQQLGELRSPVLPAPAGDHGSLRFPLFSTESQNRTRAFLPHLTHILCKSVLRVCSNLVGHSSYAILNPSSNVTESCAVNSSLGWHEVS